jgi:hypothetical protein
VCLVLVHGSPLNDFPPDRLGYLPHPTLRQRLHTFEPVTWPSGRDTGLLIPLSFEAFSHHVFEVLTL